MINIGFIGYGKSVHRYHLPFIDSKKFKVVGYFKRSDNQFEMEYPFISKDVKRFDSLNQLLHSEIDLVIIATPANTHYSLAKKSLEAGKNVLIEKPICSTLKELSELYNIADQNNCKLLPYQNRRFDSDFLTFKKVIEQGNLGKIIEIESNYTFYRFDNVPPQGNVYSGALYGLGVHFIDQIISYFGKPNYIYCDSANCNAYALGLEETSDDYFPEDYYDLKFIYDTLRIRIHLSSLVTKNPPRWIVHGTKGSFEKYMIDQQERDLKKGIFPNDPNFALNEEDTARIYYCDGTQESFPTVYGGYHLFYNQLYDCLTNNTPIPVSPEDTNLVLEILENLIYDSI